MRRVSILLLLTPWSMLPCHASHNLLGSGSSPVLFGKRRGTENAVAARTSFAAFISGVGQNKLGLKRRSVSVYQRQPVSFGKPRLSLSLPFHRHGRGYQSTTPTPIRNSIINRLALAASDNDENEQQNGMEEAFASLESLSSEDWEVNSKDDSQNYDLKYSRTDDTPASDAGKSTQEEVDLYLDMQGELDGTAVSQEGTEQSEEEDENQLLDMSGIETEDFDEPEDDSEEYPWTSINPILRLRGPVATGYGRGGKKLGVPTANLPASLFQSALEEASNGVYFGWAVIEQPPNNDNSIKKGRNKPIKAVVNVGYSPTFEGQENKEKIAEAHLLTKDSPMEKNEMAGNSADDGEETIDIDNDVAEIEGDFYGETMRLQLIGYLRPEQKFDSFPELISQIHRDIGNADWALDSMPFIFSKEDEFVKDGGVDWVGGGGGDEGASWEFESW